MCRIKCLILDDEPIAAQVIKSYLDKLDRFEVLKITYNPIEAFEYLQSNAIDLVFLDIQMPRINGLEFLKSLHEPPRVIIVTAFRDFAYEGFELNVVDYLLKPVSFDRFLKAIDKYFHLLPANYRRESDSKIDHKTEGSSVWVRADRKNVKIYLEEIQYIQGLKDYVKIFTDQQLIISKMALKKIEMKLPAEKFIRIHRSYLIPISKVTAFNNEAVEIGPMMLPIGKMFKNSVVARLEQRLR